MPRATGCIVQILLVAHVLASDPAAAQSLFFSSGGGSKSMTVSTAVAGAEPDDVTDETAELTWDATGIGSTAKITVDTSAPGQSFSLFVTLSLTSGSGTEQSQVTLTDGMLEADILRDIPTGDPSGTGTIAYRASATAAQGTSAANGSDSHSITYTILAQ